MSLLLTFGDIQAQNLVPNPSFEGMNACPTGLNNISLAPSTADVLDWYSPTDGAPDLFSSCVSSPSSAGVPSNLYGFQFAQTDSSYAGVTVYGPGNNRDYLAVQLTTPMTEGQAYCVDFNVSLADFTYIASSGMGAYFTNDPAEANNILNGGLPLSSYVPQVQYTGLPITDASGWTSINGTFIPDDAGYQWMIIGNFSANASTTTVDVSAPGVSGFLDLSYYYIEDVSVEALADVELSYENAGETTDFEDEVSVCIGDELTFTATAGPGSTYSWVNATDPFTEISNADTLTILALDNEAYFLTVTDGVCKRTLSFTVNVAQIAIIDITAENLCEGQVISVFDNSTNVSDGATYLWEFFDGATVVGTSNTLGGTFFDTNSSNVTAVKLTITGEENCPSEFTLPISLDSDCDPCTDGELIQNIVPNPSFEFYTACPDTLSESATINTIDEVAAWSMPTAGTSDYFHECGGESAGITENFFGDQAPVDGNAYAGFYAYRSTDYREYLSTQLTQELAPGKNYCVSFDLSLSDESGRAVDRIGMHFSDDDLGFINTQAPLFTYTPQIAQEVGDVVGNPGTWTTISGVYTPSVAGLDWITIGNFYANSATTDSIITGAAYLNDAYYYLDNVIVTPMPTLTLTADDVAVGNEISVCEGDEISLEAAGDFCSFSWYNINDGSLVAESAELLVTSPTDTTMTFVVSGDAGTICSITDTITVNFSAVPDANFEITENCAGAVTIFTNTSTDVDDDTNYIWTFGDGSPDLNTSSNVVAHFYTDPGTYNVVLKAVNETGCIGNVTLVYEVSAACDPCENQNNLVLNPSFELIDDCPDTLADFELANFWTSNNEADLFNDCATGDAGVPNNAQGQQAAFDGNGYAGIVVYSDDGNAIMLPNDNEFLSGEIQPLEIGQTYCVTYQVSLSDSSSYAIDEMSVLFGNDPFDFDPFSTDYEPQLENQENITILDAGEWTEISGQFVAEDSYDYLTIGNFEVNRDSFNITYLGGELVGQAYYYIDQISVVPMTVMAPEDETICRGESIQLTAETNTCDYYWIVAGQPDDILSTDTILTVSPSDTTTYVFFGDNGTCSLNDTVVVNVLPSPDFTLSPDELNLCAGDSILVSANGEGSFEWSTTADFSAVFSTTDEVYLNPADTTWYYVRAENIYECVVTDSFQLAVNPLPVADIIGEQYFVCGGDSIRLTATGGDEYIWEPAEFLTDENIADPTAYVTEETTFYVTVTDAETGCSAIDSVIVTPLAAYPVDTAFVSICAGETIEIDAGIPTDALAYLWQPAVSLDSINVVSPITSTSTDVIYTVYFIDAFGCIGQSSVEVDVIPVPNAGPDVEICEGGSVQLNASAGGTSYSWTPVAGLSDPNIANPIANPTSTQTYTVTVVYPGGSGSCTSTDEVVVNVNPTGFAVASADQTICEGDAVQLSAFGGDSYQWATDEDFTTVIANTDTLTVMPLVTTTYYVSVGNTVTGCISFEEVVVNVSPNEAPTITTALNEVICAEPLTPIEVCMDFDYVGCEGLIFDVETQLSSSITSTVSADGEFCFTYNSAFSAAFSDTLQISICTNESAQCDQIQAILVNCDEGPEWSLDTLAVFGCQNVFIGTALPTVTDPNGAIDPLNFTLLDPTFGSAVLNGEVVTYTPDNDEPTPYTSYVPVVACDTLYPIQCDTFVIAYNILGNDAPIVSTTDTTLSVFVNESVVYCPAFSDPDGDELTWTIGQTTNGTLAFNSDSTCVTYTPNTNYAGLDAGSLQLFDDCGNFVNISLNFEVEPSPANLPPIIDDTTVNTIDGEPITFCPEITEPEGQDVDLSIILPSFNTSVQILGDTCFTYLTSQTNYIPLDSFQVVACDPFEACDTAWMYIIIDPIPNEPPTIESDTIEVPFNTSALICPDIADPDGDDLLVNVIDGPFNGNSNSLNDTCWIYGPNPNYVGPDSLQMTVCDPLGLCDTAWIYINVLPSPNQAPIVEDDEFDVPYETPFNFCVEAADPNGDPLSMSIITDVDNGTVIFPDPLCITYTPDDGFIGTDTLEVILCDGQVPELCDTGTYIFNVLPPVVDNPPILNSSTYEVVQNTDFAFCLDFIEEDGEEVTSTILLPPVNASLGLDSDTCMTYIPNTDFIGADSIQVVLCDEPTPVLCDTNWVYFNVVPSNFAPDVSPAAGNLPSGTDNEICITASDPDGDDLSYDIISITPPSGTAVVDSDGCVLYSAPACLEGTVVIEVEVCDNGTPSLCTITTITYTVTNQAPTASNETATIGQNETTTICPGLADPNGDSVEITNVDGADNATITIIGGCIEYDPDPTFVGTEVLTYEVCDCVENCTTATITITVEDALIAVDDNGASEEGVPITIDVQENDTAPDADALTYTIIEGPYNGNVNDLGFGEYAYVSNEGFVGVDSFVYVICDPVIGCDTAVVYITISNALIANDDADNTGINEPVTIDILGNDVLPDGFEDSNITIIDGVENGGLTAIGDGEYTYIPDDGFVGTDTFTYVISYPGFGSDTAIVIITVVDDTPEGPTAVDDAESIEEGTTANIDVVFNDTDPSGGLLTVTDITTEPTNGTVVNNGDGTITYIPDAGFSGTDSFEYIVCNEDGLCDSAIVTITVIENTDCSLTFYNVITPDGDGTNDEFVVGGLGCIENQDNNLKIFNRWGNCVFDLDDYGSGNLWNGTYQNSGEPVADGTYFYLFTESNGTEHGGYVEVHRFQ